MNRKGKVVIIIFSILSIIIMFNIFIIEVSIVKVIKDYNLREEKLELETSRDFCSRDLFSDQLTYLVNEQLVYDNLDEKNIYNDIINKEIENTFKKYFESKGWKYSLRLDRDGVNTGIIRLVKDGIDIDIVGNRNNAESTIYKEYFTLNYIMVTPVKGYFDYILYFTNEEINNMLNENYKLNNYEKNDNLTEQMSETFYNFLDDYRLYLKEKC